MSTIQSLFALGMKRALPDLFPVVGPKTLELGPGNSPVSLHSHKLDWPDWDGEVESLPFAAGTFSNIVAFHFFEHFPGKRVIALLRECERVLAQGGVLTTVVPHRLGAMSIEDLDHKSIWGEDTWRVLFHNDRYTKNRETPWAFRVHFNLITGVNERNLAIISQLVKGGRDAP